MSDGQLSLSAQVRAAAGEGAGEELRIFSGIQPTNTLHLGNYVGAMRQWVERQHEGHNVYCVVDLHALTVPEEIDPTELQEAVRSIAALYFAVGIDPERNIVFVQSHVKEHTELTWLLNCITPLGWLYRMTQFKSKSESRESVGTGLLDYPVLMAADILLYDTTRVPVGDDQVQHIELTRDIAARFNHLFGETFVLPKAVIPEFGARIMGFDDPTAKMSKSVAAGREGHAVNLLDDEKRIRKTIMGAVTDSGREVSFERGSPGIRNLLSIYQSLTGEAMGEIEREFEGAGYGQLKRTVADAVIETLAPIQARYGEFMSDRAELDRILAKGARRAAEIASRTMQRVRSAMGVG